MNFSMVNFLTFLYFFKRRENRRSEYSEKGWAKQREQFRKPSNELFICASFVIYN